jgi:hypothetical protein
LVCCSPDAEVINVDGVGPCTPALDFVMWATHKTRHESQSCIANMLRIKDKEDVAEILCRKAKVSGYTDHAYVITFKECFELLQYLPRHAVKGIYKAIHKQFARLRAGDQTLHTEIDAQAANNGPEAMMARSSIGLPALMPVVNDDVVGRAMKRRCLELDISEREARVTDSLANSASKNCERLMSIFTVVKELSGGTLDSRETQLYKDSMLNMAIKPGQLSITNGDEGVMDEITVTDTMLKLGYKVDNSISKIGKRVAKEWRAANPGKELQKVKKLVNGTMCSVSRYFERDRELMERVIHRFRSESRDVALY